MAGHDPIPIEEYEYVEAPNAYTSFMLTLLIHSRYEGLPPNFSLSANLLAGAFAGISVSLRQYWSMNPSWMKLIETSGTYGHVSHRCNQGRYIHAIIWKTTDRTYKIHRLACR